MGDGVVTSLRAKPCFILLDSLPEIRQGFAFGLATAASNDPPTRTGVPDCHGCHETLSALGPVHGAAAPGLSCTIAHAALPAISCSRRSTYSLMAAAGINRVR